MRSGQQKDMNVSRVCDDLCTARPLEILILDSNAERTKMNKWKIVLSSFILC